MMPVVLTTVVREDRELRVNTGSVIDSASLSAVLGSFLTTQLISKIDTSPTHVAGASLSRTMRGSMHHLRCMQNIEMSGIASCIMRLDACRCACSIARSQPVEYPSFAPPNYSGYHLSIFSSCLRCRSNSSAFLFSIIKSRSAGGSPSSTLVPPAPMRSSKSP